MTALDNHRDPSAIASRFHRPRSWVGEGHDAALGVASRRSAS